jgi:hypothetical protein
VFVVTNISVGVEVLTAVVMKSSVFCDITPCSPLKVNQSFGGTCRLHLQDRRISQAKNQHETGSKQSNWLAKNLDFIGNRRDMKDKPVPFGPPT